MDYNALYEKAWAAGVEAAKARVPVPMHVVQTDPATGAVLKRYEPVMDGVCGFAWIKFKGNTPFGRWAKAAGKARKGYPNGLQVWISGYDQSMERKEAHASAMAAVLREAGIEAYGESRMD